MGKRNKVNFIVLDYIDGELNKSFQDWMTEDGTITIEFPVEIPVFNDTNGKYLTTYTARRKFVIKGAPSVLNTDG